MWHHRNTIAEIFGWWWNRSPHFESRFAFCTEVSHWLTWENVKLPDSATPKISFAFLNEIVTGNSTVTLLWNYKLR